MAVIAPTPLPSSRLHATYDPARIPADDSTGIRPAPETGKPPFQDRAVEALDLALNITSIGYNVYLAGDVNLGRRHMLCQYLQPLAKKGQVPPDLIFVRNFSDEDRPRLLQIPAGLGRKLRDGLQECLSKITQGLQLRVSGASFLKERSKLLESFQTERNELLRRMNQAALTRGFSLDIDRDGELSLLPVLRGKKVSQDDLESLDAGARLTIKNQSETVARHISGMAAELSRAEEGYLVRERDLERKFMSSVLDTVLSPFVRRMEKACPTPEFAAYFDALRADMLDNTDAFLARDEHHAPADAQMSPQLQPMPSKDSLSGRYAVNLFVDNAQRKGAPVIVEDHPTAANLLGCIERESELGNLVTDFTLISAGSIHRANGGYLVLHMDDLMTQPAAWEGMLRALKAGCSCLDDRPDAPDSTVRVKGIRPDSIPLDLKIILIGDEYLYEAMIDSDARFARLFRIKAEMTDSALRTAPNIHKYLSMLSRIIELDKLLPFDRSALAGLIDLGSQLCEDQKRLSLKFPIIRELMVEANATARLQGADKVTGAILEDSLRARRRRQSLVEELYMDEYDRNMIKVETSGKAVGQVNGLAVTTYGSFDFGLPHRISCTVGVGHDGVIDLEREADLGGPIHTKAMMILGSYLTGMFARKKPLMFSASLFFEQSYAGIEGDSASGAELAALLSALAEVPIRLDLAFTGAVSHSGQIMAVGGVDQKIEGFFKVCSRHKLTGKQGVIIPADNVDRLMLPKTVLKAVDDGLFSIYPVTSIEEALLLLTGMPAGRRKKNGSFTKGSLYELVDERLEQLGEYGQNAFHPRPQRKKPARPFQKPVTAPAEDPAAPGAPAQPDPAPAPEGTRSMQQILARARAARLKPRYKG